MEGHLVREGGPYPGKGSVRKNPRGRLHKELKLKDSRRERKAFPSATSQQASQEVVVPGMGGDGGGR